MAKGNFLTNTVAGKLGAMVLYRAGGEQRSRSYVKTVSNPRTRSQLDQRTQLANLVATYRALKGIMSSAFENVAYNQSMYNAFVSANLNRGVSVHLPKTLAQAGGCIVAPYQITKGTLSPVVITGLAPNAVTNINLGALTIGAATTITDFSNAIVANNPGIDYGMQLSYVSLIQQTNVGTGLPYAHLLRYEITLSNADTTLLSDMFPPRALGVTGGFLSHVEDTVLGGYAWVWSKVVNSAVHISSQYLQVTSNVVLNEYAGSGASTRAGDSYGVGDSVFYSPLTTSAGVDQPTFPSVIGITTSAGIDIKVAMNSGSSFSLEACKVSGNHLSEVAAAAIFVATGHASATDAQILAGATAAVISEKTDINLTLAGQVSGAYTGVALVLDNQIVWKYFAAEPDEDPNA